MTRKQTLQFVFFFLGSLLCSAPPLGAKSSHDYSETRVHNVVIEQRLSEWHARALLHKQALLNSPHPKIVRWRQQLAAISFTDEVAGLQQLNKFINSDVEYIDDYSHYHLGGYGGIQGGIQGHHT
jgi:hypothetical protein